MRWVVNPLTQHMKKVILPLLAMTVLGMGMYAAIYMSPLSQPGPSGMVKLERIKAHHGVQTGDLIFQTSPSSLGKAIQLATHSKYSHVGIIYEQDGQFYVYEAIQPVSKAPLGEWIDRGVDDHYVIKRLKNANDVLTPEALTRMIAVGKRFEGKDYDGQFAWSDDRLYCSELVWKIYQEGAGIEIGQLQTLSSFDLSSELVKQKLEEHYGGNIPLDEPVISPEAMFQSPLLKTVDEGRQKRKVKA